MKYIKIFICAVFLSNTHAASADDQGTGYKQSRDAMMKKSAGNKKAAKFTARDRQIMKDAQQTAQKNNPEPGLKVGVRAPDFTLLNAFGSKVSLAQQLKKGPVVLVFYRGAWCPFCNLHLHALQKNAAAIKSYKATILAVTPQQPDKSKAQVEKDKFPFEILSDLDDAVMKSYDLYYALSPQLHKLYKSKGLDVEKFNGKGRVAIPVPGTFVIDKDGIIKAMHADHDYKERMEPADIIKALKAL